MASINSFFECKKNSSDNASCAPGINVTVEREKREKNRKKEKKDTQEKIKNKFSMKNKYYEKNKKTTTYMLQN